MISAVITCAGNGSRFGKDKLFALIDKEPVFIRTVRQFLAVKGIGEVILAVREANKKQFESRLDELEQYYAKLQEKFLSEETEELASAKLQEMINNLATKNGLVVSRSTALKKEVINKKPYLIAMSINFEISDLDSSQKLQNFLYDIEYNNDKLLFIDNLRIKTLGLNVIKGATISSTLTAIASIGKKL